MGLFGHAENRLQLVRTLVGETCWCKFMVIDNFWL